MTSHIKVEVAGATELELQRAAQAIEDNFASHGFTPMQVARAHFNLEGADMRLDWLALSAEETEAAVLWIGMTDIAAATWPENRRPDTASISVNVVGEDAKPWPALIDWDKRAQERDGGTMRDS